MASAVPPRLHCAARRGEKGKIKQYLKAGDDVNARDPDGRTALLWTVLGDHLKCLEILLAAGADPSINDNEQGFPLYGAVENTNMAIAKALIEANADVNATIEGPGGGTALSPAVFSGSKAMVALLLDAGCDVAKTAAGGPHPLAVASLEGHAEIVAMLLDIGADANAVSPDGRTPLTSAAQKGYRDIIKILLERGADVNKPGRDGRAALHWVAQQGFDVVINILTAAGADVNRADDETTTPLHLAAFCGHPKCAYALLRAGANVLARDIRGASSLHIAAFKGHTEVIEVLLEAGGQADVNFEDNENRTPLIAASLFADVKAVNLLLDAGAHINRPDRNGRTALFTVSDVKIMQALLDRGADVKVLDKLGATVLHVAGNRGASTSVICALFKGGADPTVKDVADRTAADYAREQGHEDAAKLLDLLAAKHRALNRTSYI